MNETAPAINRKAIPQKCEFVNFKQDKFSFLNITAQFYYIQYVAAVSLRQAEAGGSSFQNDVQHGNV